MRTPLLLLVVAAIVLAIIVGTEQPVAAGIVTPPAAESGNTPVIRALQRPSRAEFALSAAARDPFFAQDRAPVAAANASAPRTPPVAAPSFPAYRILGKQQNDEGWSVFISSPGNQGQVWVVREGEAFDEHFRVSKLAPTVLIVKNARNSQIRTFDIGKDEE